MIVYPEALVIGLFCIDTQKTAIHKIGTAAFVFFPHTHIKHINKPTTANPSKSKPNACVININAVNTAKYCLVDKNSSNLTRNFFDCFQFSIFSFTFVSINRLHPHVFGKGTYHGRTYTKGIIPFFYALVNTLLIKICSLNAQIFTFSSQKSLAFFSP